VLADVAEGLDVAQPAQPVEVVDDRVVGALNRAEDGLVDRALGVDIGRDGVGGVELRSADLPEGSPMRPVPPPMTTTGVCPARLTWARSMIGTRLPIVRLGAVGSKPE
jgi:hypothetical protein